MKTGDLIIKYGLYLLKPKEIIDRWWLFDGCLMVVWWLVGYEIVGYITWLTRACELTHLMGIAMFTNLCNGIGFSSWLSYNGWTVNPLTRLHQKAMPKNNWWLMKNYNECRRSFFFFNDVLWWFNIYTDMQLINNLMTITDCTSWLDG